MGNNQSSTQKLYTFLQTYNDPIFGQCSIYKHKFHPNEFIVGIRVKISHQQVHLVDENLKLFRQKQQMQSCGKMPFLKIVDWRFSTGENAIGGKDMLGICRVPELTVYVEFLRHTLREFREWRVAENRPFTLQQIEMVVGKAITAYELTKIIDNSLLGPSLKLQDVAVTVQGEVRFSPLMGKKFLQKIVGEGGFCLKKGRKALREKRRLYYEECNGFSSSKQEFRSTGYSLEEDQFLDQLKKFAISLAPNNTYHKQTSFNPQDSHYTNEQKSSVNQLLHQITHASTLSQVKKLVGKPQIDAFYVDFSRMRHQQFEAKFQKILQEMEEKSQRTDYTNNGSSTRPSINKYHTNQVTSYIPPLQFYHSNA